MGHRGAHGAEKLRGDAMRLIIAPLFREAMRGRTALRYFLPAVLVGTMTSLATASGLAPCAGVHLMRPPAAAKALEPVPANPAGCTLGHRFPVEAGVTLWRCLVVAQNGAESRGLWSHALLVMREGQPVHSYRDTLADGRFDAWHVLGVDLDDDGAEERIVALWNRQEKGSGINAWTIHVFSNTWQPLGWFDEVFDWGPSSIVAAMPGRAGCNIALTSYEQEGSGTVALEAAFIRLEDGRLVEATDRPPVCRPLDVEFQRERTAHFSRDENRAEGDIAAWLGKSTCFKPH